MERPFFWNLVQRKAVEQEGTHAIESIPLSHPQAESFHQQIMGQVNQPTTVHKIVIPQGRGEETIARFNALIKHSGAQLWIDTPAGLLRVLEFRAMSSSSNTVFLISMDYKGRQRGFSVPWDAKFHVYLGPK